MGEKLEGALAKPFGVFVKGFNLGRAYRQNGWAGVGGNLAGMATGAGVTEAVEIGVPLLIAESAGLTAAIATATAAAPVAVAIAGVAAIWVTGYIADKAGEWVSCKVTNWLK